MTRKRKPVSDDIPTGTGVMSRKYNILLYREHSGSGYTVRVAEFPSIVTQGDTFDEAIEMARDAIQLAVADRGEDGQDDPPDLGRAILVYESVNP